MVVLLVGVIGAAGLVAYGYTSTQRPNANADFQTATTFVYYNNGKSQLGSFAVQNRQPLTFEQIPQNVKDGVVAAENRDFWTDRGVSIRGMFRAAWVILRGGDLQGGSTITQQYIKIMYLNSEQTVTRKFRELFLAYKINKEMSKEEILTDYLNTIYFGRGAYGIQAASKAYFDVDAEDLTTQQAAVLISVINNPSLFDPGVDEANIPRLKERYAYVLNSMAETGAITPAQAAEYAAALPEFPEVKINERYGGPKGFLLKMVEKELVGAGFEPSQISGGGLKITTTFDKADQNAAVKSAQKYTKEAADASNQKASQLHAAVASVEVGTGEVLAIYGGPDYVKNSRNWATTARPTASTFKTYALAAGLDDGFSLDSRFNGNTFTPEGDSTTVRNEFNYAVRPRGHPAQGGHRLHQHRLRRPDHADRRRAAEGRGRGGGGRRAQGRRLGPQLTDRAGHRRGQPAEPGERVRDLRQRRHLRRAARGEGGQGRERQGGLPGRTRGEASGREGRLPRCHVRADQRGGAGHR